MRILVTFLLGSLLHFGHAGKLLADEKTPPQRQPAEKLHLVATVFGEPIYLEWLTPVGGQAVWKNLVDKKLETELDYAKWLRGYRTQALMSQVSGKVMKEYAIREKLSPSDQEIKDMIREACLKYSGNFGADDESQRKLAIQTMFLVGSSCEWRTAKALHEKYGGRIATSSFGGWISIEGRNALLKDYATSGDIKFADPDLEAAFWEKLKDKRVLDVTVPVERVAGHFKFAPWELWINEQVAKDFEAKPSPVKSD